MGCGTVEPVSVDSTTEHQGHRPGTDEYRRLAVALFFAGVATFTLLYSTQAVLPALAEQFGVGAGESAWSLSATTLGLALALLVAGPLSDRFGRTRLIHTSLALSALVGLACALAPSWPALLGLRLAEGVALAGLPAVATAYLREELHVGAHARAVGLYVGGTAIGGMTGRLLTGAVTEAFGWRWALAAAAGLGLACAVLVRVLLPSSRRFVPRPAGWRVVLTTTRLAVTDRGLLALFGIGGCSIGVLTVVFNTVGFRLARLRSTSVWRRSACCSASTRSARSARRSQAGLPIATAVARSCRSAAPWRCSGSDSPCPARSRCSWSASR